MALKISIAEDFSPWPSGRYPTDGKFNGETFREEFLLPAIRSENDIVIFLDGLESYADSFFDEAFGGLSRVHGIDPEKVKRLVTVTSRDKLSSFFLRTLRKFVTVKVPA